MSGRHPHPPAWRRLPWKKMGVAMAPWSAYAQWARRAHIVYAYHPTAVSAPCGPLAFRARPPTSAERCGWWGAGSTGWERDMLLGSGALGHDGASHPVHIGGGLSCCRLRACAADCMAEISGDCPMVHGGAGLRCTRFPKNYVIRAEARGHGCCESSGAVPNQGLREPMARCPRWAPGTAQARGQCLGDFLGGEASGG